MAADMTQKIDDIRRIRTYAGKPQVFFNRDF